MGTSLQKVYDLLKMMIAGRRLISFDALEERGRSVMSLIADERAPPFEEGPESHLHHSLRRVIGVSLTQKQKEVICLLLEGKSNKEIENELFISIHTVRNHIYNIYKRLGIKNRVELVNLIRNFLYPP